MQMAGVGSNNETAKPPQGFSGAQAPSPGEHNPANMTWGGRWPTRPVPPRGPGQCGPPRRVVHHARANYGFPGHRGAYGMPPQQYYQQQRKQRPNWTPRAARPPFPIPNGDNYMPYQQHWGPSQPPQASGEPSTEEPPKKKKKTTNGNARPWSKEAAERALALELECQKNAGANAIVIRFPDPELSKEIVQQFHPSIDNVHFQAPCGGRYCFVTLKEDNDVEKVMSDINRIRFGVGYLQAERKVQKIDDSVGPENIDPFTLYVGNLPTNISAQEVKEKFPTADRIDVGYAQKMKFTRYAFVKYGTAEAALAGYRASINTIISSRSIILRFRRHKAPVGPPGEKPSPSIIEPKPGEKLTVGAKLKAKKEKSKAEKAAREKERQLEKQRKRERGELDDDDETDEEERVEMDDDDSVSSDSHSEMDDEDDDSDEAEIENDDDDVDQDSEDELDVEDDDDDSDDGPEMESSDVLQAEPSPAPGGVPAQGGAPAPGRAPAPRRAWARAPRRAPAGALARARAPAPVPAGGRAPAPAPVGARPPTPDPVQARALALARAQALALAQARLRAARRGLRRRA